MPGLSSYGVPGHIDMPSAWALPDGTFAFTLNQFGPDVRRATMAFQISPRITGVFRYSYLSNYFSNGGSLYDRSFDLRYQILTENPNGWRPALSVGLQDFGGTGIFSAEYLVASKHFGESVSASAGIGWGRFGSYGSFRNPLSVLSDRFDTRGGFTGIADTGRVGFDRFFRGDAALFLGVDWQVTPKLQLSFEYSSDAMEQETSRMGYRHRSPVNLGIEYRFDNGGVLGLAVLHGSEASLSYTLSLDPARPSAPSGRETAPPAISRGTTASLASWGDLSGSGQRARLEEALSAQGIRFEGLSLNGETAIVAISNQQWGNTAQAWGRTARVLSAELPQDITRFRIRSYDRGMALKDVTLSRADLEELEFAPDGAWQAFVRADIRDAGALPDPRLDLENLASLRLLPYTETAFFDPDNPLRMDFGAELQGEWMPGGGLYFSGAIRQKLVGNLDTSTRISDSIQQHVRSDAALYAKNDGPWLAWATAEWFARPGPDLYSRVSAGIFEKMFGGVSGEILWAPADRPYALGVELNYVAQRDYDGALGFLDYDVLTGHASLYYDFGRGYHAQVDAGRYLAGDTGSTLTLTRRFGNGFEVGAFFTLTDISFDDFGEGSFDKGITISLPLSWITGQPTRQRVGQVIRPIQRDGGARLSIRNRLYGLTHDGTGAAQGIGWGRFWR
ncbi:YjbH domain-containing protein [Pseudogemmobacter humi]|nr:YjbH domain-containing protein [Pseudogemmobacter humi]